MWKRERFLGKKSFLIEFNFCSCDRIHNAGCDLLTMMCIQIWCVWLIDYEAFAKYSMDNELIQTLHDHGLDWGLPFIPVLWLWAVTVRSQWYGGGGGGGGAGGGKLKVVFFQQWALVYLYHFGVCVVLVGSSNYVKNSTFTLVYCMNWRGVMFFSGILWAHRNFVEGQRSSTVLWEGKWIPAHRLCSVVSTVCVCVCHCVCKLMCMLCGSFAVCVFCLSCHCLCLFFRCFLIWVILYYIYDYDDG